VLSDLLVGIAEIPVLRFLHASETLRSPRLQFDHPQELKMLHKQPTAQWGSPNENVLVERAS